MGWAGGESGEGEESSLRPFHWRGGVDTCQSCLALSSCLGTRPTFCTWLCPALDSVRSVSPLPNASFGFWQEVGGCKVGGRRDLLLCICSLCSHHWGTSCWLQPLLLSTHQSQPRGTLQRSQHWPGSTPFSILPASGFWWQIGSISLVLCCPQSRHLWTTLWIFSKSYTIGQLFIYLKFIYLKPF